MTIYVLPWLSSSSVLTNHLAANMLHVLIDLILCHMEYAECLRYIVFLLNMNYERKHQFNELMNSKICIVDLFFV